MGAATVKTVLELFVEHGRAIAVLVVVFPGHPLSVFCRTRHQAPRVNLRVVACFELEREDSSWGGKGAMVSVIEHV
jgi:hypothetical protein